MRPINDFNEALGFLKDSRQALLDIIDPGPARQALESLLSDEAFAEFSSRRTRAIAFAHTKRTRIHFIACSHPKAFSFKDLATEDKLSPEQVEVRQQITYEAIKRALAKNDFMMIESAGGTTGPLTVAKIEADSRETSVRLGTNFNEAEIEDWRRWLKGIAWIRVMEEHPDYPVLYGEDWLSHIQFIISTLMYQFCASAGGMDSAFKTPDGAAIGILNALTIKLRSEGIVIRAMELLQERGGKSVLVAMGAFHAEDIKILSRLYGYRLTVEYVGVSEEEIQFNA